MRYVTPLVLLFVSCASAPKPLMLPNCACSVSRHEVARDYARADVVFTGTVLDISPAPRMENPPRLLGPRVLAVTLSAYSVYKGGALTNPVLYVDTIWACAYPFVAGESYLVYAWSEHRFKNELTTTTCVRTMPFEQAKSDLRELRRITATRRKK